MTIRKLTPATLPKSSTAVFSEIKRVIKLGWIDVPDKKSYRGTGTQGRLIEDLLEIKENNNDSPDLKDWEVKTHQGGTLITLFHKEPEPKGIMTSIVHTFGWMDNQGRMSFRHTLESESKRGFYVVNELDRVLIRNNAQDMVVPYWTHNAILGIAGRKLSRLVLVDCEVNKVKKQIRYTGATAFWEFNLTGFCDAMHKGIVKIDFDARTQKGPGTSLRNHGTKFRVSASDIHLLYQNSKKIT